MVRILVIPERLENMSRQMAQAASSLRSIEGHLSRALGGLEWEVRQQANVEGQVNAARRQAQTLASEAERLARWLAERAQAFQQADQQGAEMLGATTQHYLAAARSVLPQLSLLMSYMSAGRVYMQKFLDLVGIKRYGPLAPWLKIGVLDQRTRLAKTVGKVGVGLGIVSDVLTADEVNEKTISVAVIRNVGEYGIGSAVPLAGIALAGNALVQLAGTGMVMGSRALTPVIATSQAMAEDLNASTDHYEQTLKRADLGRITKDISNLIYDAEIAPRWNAMKAAWEQPNLTNVGRLFMALNPMTPAVTWMTADDGKAVWEDIKKLGSDAFDFVKSIPDLALATVQHGSAMYVASRSKSFSTLPLPDAWKTAVTQSCELLVDILSRPVTVDGLWNTVATAMTSPPSPYSMEASWSNSVQFVPIVPVVA